MGAPLDSETCDVRRGLGPDARAPSSTIDEEIVACREELLSGEMAQYFLHDTLFVEKFIRGPEFTVVRRRLPRSSGRALDAAAHRACLRAGDPAGAAHPL